MKPSSFIEISFAPSLNLVSKVREFAAEVYDEMLHDAEIVSRLEIASHELLENAVKHAGDRPTRMRIECRSEAQGPHLVIQTWNEVTEHDYEELTGLIQTMNASSNPDAYYQTLMQRAAYRTSGSGLGLGRIWAEARMAIRCSREGSQVCVTAESIADANRLTG